MTTEPNTLDARHEHIALVGQIDSRVNGELTETRKGFTSRHSRVDPEQNPDWEAIARRIEQDRHHEFSKLCEQVVDSL